MSLYLDMVEASLPLDIQATVPEAQKGILPESHGCEYTINVVFTLPLTSVFLDGSVAHNEILAHAQAVKIYREQFKPLQNGLIGITLNGDWTMPFDNSPESESCLLTSLFLGYCHLPCIILFARCPSSSACHGCCNRCDHSRSLIVCLVPHR